MRNRTVLTWSALIAAVLPACFPQPYEPKPAELPSLAYSGWVKDKAAAEQNAERRAAAEAYAKDPSVGAAARAQLKLVKNTWEAGDTPRAQQADIVTNANIVTNEGPAATDPELMRTSAPIRDYNGPLSLGDPGLSSSLWQESRRGGELFRDERAFQPMDLITILVTENAEGQKTADTEIKGKSNTTATVSDWLGILTALKDANKHLSDENNEYLVKAATTNDYKGEGDTTRKDSLKATISAMVVEVLPGNVLRIEGEKIISLNQEEQTIVISGLVRPRDVNSNNEVLSSKLANLRIDYYGRGTVGEAQYGGWFSRAMRVLWPF